MLGLFAVILIAVPDGSARAAAQISAQAPCTTGGGGECFNFGVGIVGLGQFDMRSFAFRAPSKGTAEVTFHGSLVCGADNSRANVVVDLITQIVNSRTAVPQANGPGGMRQAVVLRANTSDSFNLASTRTFSFGSAGTQTFYFRVRPLRIDSGTDCYIYNAAFTVMFIS